MQVSKQRLFAGVHMCYQWKAPYIKKASWTIFKSKFIYYNIYSRLTIFKCKLNLGKSYKLQTTCYQLSVYKQISTQAETLLSSLLSPISNSAKLKLCEFVTVSSVLISHNNGNMQVCCLHVCREVSVKVSLFYKQYSSACFIAVRPISVSFL